MSVSDVQYLQGIDAAGTEIQKKLGKCDIALVLGSGLGSFPQYAFGDNCVKLPYREIPGMPTTNVIGHAGLLIAGNLGPHRVLCFSGRFHSYEGFDTDILTLIPRLARAAGCHTYLVTNAAGAVLPGARPGVGMIINDHHQFVRWNSDSSCCYHPATPKHHRESAYTKSIADLAENISRRPEFQEVTGFLLDGEERRFEVFQGVYVLFSGPSYETPAEVRMTYRLGMGTVGMSTVPEVQIAAALGMDVFGMSVATNMGAGLGDEAALAHEDVKKVAEACGRGFNLLFKTLINEIPKKTIAPLVIAGPTVVPEGYVPHNVHERPARIATEAEITEAVADFKTRLGIETIKTVSFSMESEECKCPDAHKLTAFRHFSDIATSRASLMATVCHCPENGGTLCIQLVEEPLGIFPQEAHYIAAVARGLGANHGLVQYLLKDVVPIAGDKQDKSVLFNYDRIQNQSHYLPIPGTRVRHTGTDPCAHVTLRHAEDAMITQALRNLGSSEGEPRVGVVAFFSGPSLPTKTSALITERFGAHFMTTQNVSPLLGLRMMGIPAIALATNCCKQFERLHEIIVPCKDARPVGEIVRYEASTGPSFSHFVVGMGTKEQVETAAVSLRAELGMSASGVASAVCIDKSWENCPVPVEGAWVNHPELACEFAWGNGKKTILVVRGHFEYSRWAEPNWVSTMPLRICAALGVKHVTFAAPSSEYDGKDQFCCDGRVILATDQINLTGTNPLRGHNVEEFGPRFPDMKEIYTAEKRRALRWALKDMGIATDEGVIAIVPEGGVCVPDAHALSMKGGLIGARAIAQYGAFLPSVAARHSGLQVTGVLIPRCVEAAKVFAAIGSLA